MVRLAVAAMGTRFEMLLSGGVERELRAAGEAAAAEIERAHGLLSVFERSSVVSAVNRAAEAGEAGEASVDAASRGGPAGWTRVPGEVVALLQMCERVREASGGAFNAAAGGLMVAAGHRAGAEQGVRRAAAGPGVEIDAAGCRVRLVGGGAGLDRGGVGKGWGIDLAMEALREGGVRSAIVHGGTSTVAAMGVDGEGRAWRVGVGARPGERAFDVVLRDEAVSVSWTHGRVSAAGAGHTIDPRSGEGGARGRGGAGGGCGAAETDAWATAMLVQGGLGKGLGNGLGDGPGTEMVGMFCNGRGWIVEGGRAAEVVVGLDAVGA